MRALQLADRLARLPHRFGRDRAGVDDHRLLQPRFGRAGADHLGFIGVEAAAEGDDFDLAHASATSALMSTSPPKLKPTGPVIST